MISSLIQRHLGVSHRNRVKTRLQKDHNANQDQRNNNAHQDEGQYQSKARAVWIRRHWNLSLR
jgi:hypothetical protein